MWIDNDSNETHIIKCLVYFYDSCISIKPIEKALWVGKYNLITLGIINTDKNIMKSNISASNTPIFDPCIQIKLINHL